VNTSAIQDSAVTSAKIADNTVGTAKIADDAVTSAKIAADAVGASELKGVYAAVSAGGASNNTFVSQTATCSGNDRVLGGGFAWLSDATISMVYSTPDPLADPNTWIARGRSATANTLFAWATCLPA
jgi:hypothetical protein